MIESDQNYLEKKSLELITIQKWKQETVALCFVEEHLANAQIIDVSDIRAYVNTFRVRIGDIQVVMAANDILFRISEMVHLRSRSKRQWQLICP